MTMPDADQLAPYTSAGLQLIPLHSHDHIDARGRQRGKSPVDTNWTKRSYSGFDPVGHMEGGSNVGVRLGLTDLVIDVDPRGFEPIWGGVDPFVELVLRFGLDPDEYPTVLTGGGGMHLYLKKPADWPICGSLPDFPGVEFKSAGSQVVAAGSVHPTTGKAYEWEPLSPSVSDAPEAPMALLEAVRRSHWKVDASGGGEYDADELARMLERLDPSDFQIHEKWLQLMQACHHATAGDGRQEFIDWSTGDPAYASDAGLIGRRWDSLRSDNSGARVTIRTLHKFLHDAGAADVIPRVPPSDDFAEVAEEDANVLADAGASVDDSKPLSSGTPMELAGAMLRGRTYLRSGGDWLCYNQTNNRYEVIPDEEFQAKTWSWTDGRRYLRDGEAKAVVATRDSVANVIAAASAQRQGPSSLPCWHKRRDGDPEPAELLAVANGLLHLPTMQLLPPTPRFVCRNASPVAYDPNSVPPTRWLRFLAEVFLNDMETVVTLQEAMGYLLTQDTSQQKIFCLVGPVRSGKGTINRVIQALVGEGNYSSPALKDLAGDFGIERLIGKQLATISDMRMGRNSDPSALAENLLRISGEDEVSVNRKHKGAWEGRLRTRFLMLSNETPQFRDTSGAIVSRIVLLRSTASFLGREDGCLTRDLLTELPGILNWCLEGLARLNARGRFLQPAASLDALAMMDAIASPVKAFAAQRLSDDDREAETPKDVIWVAFYEWLDEAGLRYSGDKGHFFKDLGTVGLRFISTRPRIGGERVQAVRGLSLVDLDGF
ncbi:MAG: phage/plasmid primase, P4 family [Pseudomonadota bacterium]